MGESLEKHIVIVPGPVQGHINPMMQLATILHSKGFSLTVAYTQLPNSLNPSDIWPHFVHLKIPHTLSESEARRTLGLIPLVLKLNEVCEPSFIQLMRQKNDLGIACVIYDVDMYFAESAAKILKIPSFRFVTSSATAPVARLALVKLKALGLIPLKEHEANDDELVPEFHPLRFKDLPASAFVLDENRLKLYEKVSNKETTSRILFNTAGCLESSSLALLGREFRVPMLPVGPLHKMASASSASSLKEDRSCLEWLDKQKPGSVIYISIGSLAEMQHKELVEMAWGLSNSEQPFLWVIRPGSITGSDWTEPLPDELNSIVQERGCVVKWAPQREVLAHWGVGGFWSHCGWNSTLESITEGVPMICRPVFGDQMVNSRLISSVWGVGYHMEGELERGEVERVVRMLMVEKEGEGMRKKAMDLKEKVEASVRSGGSSYNSLDELVKLIISHNF